MSFLQESIVYLWLLPVTLHIVLPLAMLLLLLIGKLFWPEPAKIPESEFEGELVEPVR